MEVRILGPLEVSRDGRPVALGAAKERLLFAILLMHANAEISVERLTELLWREETPPTAAHAIEVYVSQLRRKLEPEGAPFKVLVRGQAGYSLTIDPSSIDAIHFEMSVDSAKHLPADKALVPLKAALALWRGDPLGEFAGEPFAVREAARLCELHLHALEERIEAELALGGHSALVPELVSLIGENPLRERLCGQLMLALYRSGRQADASDVYQRTRNLLVDELSMEPGPDLQSLLKRILQQDPTLSLEPTASRLPSGTVTFLMTDIEGSSRAWEIDPAATQRALERHDHLVSTQVPEDNGHVVESGREGDSFLAVFTNAADAVACATHIQVALRAEPWGLGTGIPVRVAIHTGQAEFASSHYVGHSLYRCARLMAIGHGGQILISKATEEIVSNALPDEAGLLDLGEHRLRDMSRLEHVFQLLHPALERDFPALNSLEQKRSNFPGQLTTFVGRHSEIDDLIDQLAKSRLVTLTGVGGTGKTRLALLVGTIVADRFGGGTWFVDLAPLTDAGTIPSALASVLGVREYPGRPLIAIVANFLEGASTLVLLDNCEHLIDAVASTVESLLANCPQLVVLATSRERLRVDGEWVYQVPPLELPPIDASLSLTSLRESESAQLFVDRAGQVQHSFALTDENAHDIAELCRRLDGIPLAIELAAAQVSSLTPREILQNLGDRFAILSTGSRSKSPKQRTLWATLEWSYHLLTPAEQTLFRRLSIFAGDFDLDATRAVAAAEESAAPTLIARLADKSLVIAEPAATGGTRFRLLETVREFARSLLADSGEQELMRELHAGHYLKLVQRMERASRNGDIAEWFPDFAREASNFRAALETLRTRQSRDGLDMAVALAGYWEASGSLSEGRSWLETTIPRAETDRQLLARAHYRAGLLAYFQGEYEAAWAHIQSGTEIKRELKDMAGLARQLGTLAEIALARGDAAGAVELGEEARALSISHGDARSLAWANVHLALFALHRQDYAVAQPLFAGALDALRASRDYIGLAYGFGGLSLLHSERGALAEARECLEHLIAITEQHMVWLEDASWLWASLVYAEADGRLRSAIRLWGAIRQLERKGNFWHPAYTRKYLPTVDRARTSLRASDADALMREGASMTRAQLVAEALGVPGTTLPAGAALETTGL